jgi:hypothetical protein
VPLLLICLYFLSAFTSYLPLVLLCLYFFSAFYFLCAFCFFCAFCGRFDRHSWQLAHLAIDD